MTRAFCAMDPASAAGQPEAGFNLHTGSGSGRLNGAPASIAWTFVDGGEPGRLDSATIVIRDADHSVVLSGSDVVRGGNQQAHK